jgi:hypothetical protein
MALFHLSQGKTNSLFDGKGIVDADIASSLDSADLALSGRLTEAYGV